MDAQLLASFLKVIIFLPLVIILAYLSLKLGGTRMMSGGGRLIKIVERVPLTGKSYLCVALINGKPYVVGSTEDKVEILMELPEDCLENIKQGENFKDSLITNFNLLINRKDRP